MAKDFFKARNQAIYERILRACSVTSPSDLAHFLNISRQTVNEWRSGRNAPTKKRLREIADKTGKTIDWLSDGDEEQQTSEVEIGSDEIRNQTLLDYLSAQIDLLKVKVGRKKLQEFLLDEAYKLKEESGSSQAEKKLSTR